jgi:uroporphyrinogen-III synthase
VYRKRKIFFADGDLDNLVELITTSPEESFFLPVADNHKNTLNNKLKRKKLNITKAVCYKTVSANLKEVNLDFDVICLFSPSGVTALKENYPDYTQNGTKIAAFGEETHKAVIKAGLKLDIKAPTKDCPSMAMAIEKYINNAKK